jgi:hypothetical protein
MTKLNHTSLALGPLAALTALGLLGNACGSGGGSTGNRPLPPLVVGQSDFESAPPAGATPSGAGARGGVDSGSASSGGTGSGGSAVSSPESGGADAASREVEETDLYRLDGDRLYYLNSYRGLMVFDVSNVDAPQLLGRSPIFGEPVEMVVRDGIASVVVADWYGQMDDGTPFHGSVVRGIDARDPANMKVTGEQYLGGWVRDTRVVGDVLYAVTEKYPWDYGWYGATDDSASSVTWPSVSVASVSFAGGNIQAIDSYDSPGMGGVFYVTEQAILLASEEIDPNDDDAYATPSGNTELRYLDISDPGGAIAVRGSVTVQGAVQGWGADNGRWNLDFADGRYAHVVGGDAYYAGNTQPLDITTVDFGDPDAPVVTGMLEVRTTGYSAAARFDSGRLYLSPSSWGCYGPNGELVDRVRTPLDVFDVSDPAQPKHLATASIDAQVSLMIPNGDRLFALGSSYDCTTNTASPLSLAYFDMSDPAQPRPLGAADFGSGYAWTPAAGTFKAFTKDDAQGLVVLPFSGWDYQSYKYNNGVQLIEFDAESIRTSGVGTTSGWVERGIFVKNRLVSLSDLALSVIDYSDHESPFVVSELTLARNVVNVRPVGDNVVEVSSDFWDNDQDHSELRVLPIDQAEENTSDPALARLVIDGVNPTVFHQGDMTYVVSNVRREVECEGQTLEPASDYKCYAFTQQVNVVDVSGGTARLRSKVALPTVPYYGWGWGWGFVGCGMYDWYYGQDVVQVGSKLAFRRWMPQYDATGGYVEAREALFVVDVTNPDVPVVGSTTIAESSSGWWGNLRAVGEKLFASHYEWIEAPTYDGNGYTPGRVAYYLDEIDVSVAGHPVVGGRYNVPGFLVGGSETDPSLIYTMDSRWDGTNNYSAFAVLKLAGGRAHLQGHVTIPGYTGNVFVRGNTAYFTAEIYEGTLEERTYAMRLYQVDLRNPANPIVLPSAAEENEWGWLTAVEGDRAFVTSGWYGQGIDVFRLAQGQAPVYDQFIRTRGWWSSSLAVAGDQALIASGYWGTQVLELNH